MSLNVFYYAQGLCHSTWKCRSVERFTGTTWERTRPTVSTILTTIVVGVGLRRGACPAQRHRLYRSLYPRLQRLPREGQLQGLQALWDCADTRRLTRPECRPLSGEELIRLSESRLIEIGAHTHNHVSLGDLPCSVQKREIVVGKAWLEEQLSRSIASFSYPYGLYTSETVGIVRDAGFSDACSTRCLPLRGNEDPYELPRVWPGDWDGEQLSMALRGWFYA